MSCLPAGSRDPGTSERCIPAAAAAVPGSSLAWPGTFFFCVQLCCAESVRLTGKGQPLVMVCTDVESSTELWEFNHILMMRSLAIHDRLIRANLRR